MCRRAMPLHEETNEQVPKTKMGGITEEMAEAAGQVVANPG